MKLTCISSTNAFPSRRTASSLFLFPRDIVLKQKIKVSVRSEICLQLKLADKYNWMERLDHISVTYISAGIQLYKSPEGGQLKNQQPSKSPSSASAQKRAFSSCCGTKGMCGNASQRHSFISWLSKHPQRNIWILMCTLSLICLWNMNINLGKRGLISNRALTWNV